MQKILSDANEVDERITHAIDRKLSNTQTTTILKRIGYNFLDACEEAGILPEIWVHIEAVGKDKYKASVQDNGPGIVKKQIPFIFGKLLYGSKFHRLRMSRGQQGIGISAAGMYGLLTPTSQLHVPKERNVMTAYFFSAKALPRGKIKFIAQQFNEFLCIEAL